MDLSTALTCRIFPSVARSSVHCIDDWIVHFWSSSMDVVHGRLHYSLYTTSTDVLIIVQGRLRQLYTIFLSKETFLVSLIMIPDIVRSLGHGRYLWTNWRWNKFLGILSEQIQTKSKNLTILCYHPNIICQKR